MDFELTHFYRNLPHAIDAAIPCFFSSIHGVLHLVRRLLPLSTPKNLEIAEAMKICGDMGLLTPSEEERDNQSSWISSTNKNIKDFLRTQTNTTQDKTRLLASSDPDSSCWLSVLPSSQLGTHLPNEFLGSLRFSESAATYASYTCVHVQLMSPPKAIMAYHGRKVLAANLDTTRPTTS
jgi:hypothetical protein